MADIQLGADCFKEKTDVISTNNTICNTPLAHVSKYLSRYPPSIRLLLETGWCNQIAVMNGLHFKRKFCNVVKNFKIRPMRKTLYWSTYSVFSFKFEFFQNPQNRFKKIFRNDRV